MKFIIPFGKTCFGLYFLLVLMFGSCKKESNEEPEPPSIEEKELTFCDFVGFKQGTVATYSDSTGATFVHTCVGTDTINGQSWWKIVHSYDGLNEYLMCGDSFVYWRTKMDNLYWVDHKVIQIDPKVGDKWQEKYSFEGSPPMWVEDYYTIDYEVKGVGQTKVVNGVSYNNVLEIQVKNKRHHRINGTGYYIYTYETNWYAPGYHLIEFTSYPDSNEPDRHWTLKSFQP